MLEKERSFKKLKKKIIIKLIIIYSLAISSAHPELKDKLLTQLEKTNTMSFNFQQQISNKIETGNCDIKYPKLMRCDYQDNYKKRIIANGKAFAIIQRRYDKIFYYRLKNTPLNYLLDKEYVMDYIRKNTPSNIDNRYIEYEINMKNSKLNIFFDRQSFNLKGWVTEDIYENTVEFLISDIKINNPLKKEIFRIPSLDEKLN